MFPAIKPAGAGGVLPGLTAASCPCSPEQSRLAELEEQAKSAKKGMWSEGTGSHTVRDLKYTIENPRHFVDSMHQKPVNGKLAPTRGLGSPHPHPQLLGGCSWHRAALAPSEPPAAGPTSAFAPQPS